MLEELHSKSLWVGGSSPSSTGCFDAVAQGLEQQRTVSLNFVVTLILLENATWDYIFVQSKSRDYLLPVGSRP